MLFFGIAALLVLARRVFDQTDEVGLQGQNPMLSCLRTSSEFFFTELVRNSSSDVRLQGDEVRAILTRCSNGGPVSMKTKGLIWGLIYADNCGVFQVFENPLKIEEVSTGVYYDISATDLAYLQGYVQEARRKTD